MTSTTNKSGFGIRRLASLYHPTTLREKGLAWSIGLALGTAIVIIVLLGFFWNREPGLFDVKANALELANGDDTKLVPGFVTTATIIKVADTLLAKSGGYLSNDVTPPAIFIDNMPSWEFGVLIELRDTVRALRNDFSRAQTQSLEDRNLMIADAQFHFDHTHWMLPASEGEYRDGMQALRDYLTELTEGRSRGAQFFVRGDNLNAYLAVVEKRLGSLAQRLSANVRELGFSEDARQDDAAGGQRTNLPSDITANTPWLQIDNVFYEARGYIWALLHTLKAVEIDFQNLLKSKNAVTALQRIIHKLENAQQSVWSPIILNNTGFGMLTNHSLIMASYISRANAALIDLRILLTQG